MTLILTLIAADRLDDSTLSRIRALLPQSGEPAWLSPGQAADIVFDGLTATEAELRVRAALGGHRIDLVAQRAEGRRKKLIVADMDSTRVGGEPLDELAAFAGLKDKIAAITARAMNGEIDFKAALRERVGLLAGLAENALDETYAHLKLMPGAKTLIATMRAHGAHTVLASGGFDFFTSRVRDLCGFHDDRANRLEIENGKLTGKVLDPILDRDSKLFYLRDFAEKLGLNISQTLA